MVTHRRSKAFWLCAGILGLAGVCAGAVEFAGGTGEPNDPYRIATAEHLVALGADPNLWDKHFLLVCDFDMKDLDSNAMSPIGNQVRPFLGTFDGKGHRVVNHSMTQRSDFCVGLFGCIGEPDPDPNKSPQVGHVRNVRLENLTIQWDAAIVGGLAGFLAAGTISNCFVSGTVMGGGALGGVGGLVGVSDGEIVLCSAAVTVKGEGNVGGLVGTMGGGKILRCSVSGRVEGDFCLGGLVSSVACGVFPTGIRKTEPNDIVPRGAIRQCRSDCLVIGEEFIGGLVGEATGHGKIEDCYALGSVCGSEAVGGLVGGNWGTCIIRCYSAARVAGEERIGGLVGENGRPESEADLARYPPCQLIVERIPAAHCSSDRATDGGRWRVVFRRAILACFWDAAAAGVKRGLGWGHDARDGIVSLTTAEMQTPETFRNFGWDFETVWRINEGEGYPRLQWEDSQP